MKKPIKEFTVKRSRWYRGRANDSALLTENNKMCCLGFLGRACGVKFQMFDGVPSDTTLRQGHKNWPDGIKPPNEESYTDSKFTEQIIKANDREGIKDEKREARLTTLFAKAGLKVNFVD